MTKFVGQISSLRSSSVFSARTHTRTVALALTHTRSKQVARARPARVRGRTPTGWGGGGIGADVAGMARGCLRHTHPTPPGRAASGRPVLDSVSACDSAGAHVRCLCAALFVWCAGRVLYPVPAGYIRRAVVALTVIAFGCLREALVSVCVRGRASCPIACPYGCSGADTHT